jgi:hypothetical protein
MRAITCVVTVLVLAGAAACSGSNGDNLIGGGGGGSGGAGAGAGSGAGAGGGADAGASVGMDSGGGGADAGGGGDDGAVATDAAAPCYGESYNPNANLADLKSAFTGSNWLDTSLEAMNRRYATGHFVLDGEKSDPQLSGFTDSSSWPNLMESLMTMVHEESHGYDFDHSQAGQHLYVLRSDLEINATELSNMWPRSELVPLIHDDATSNYDQTYLTGTQGTYDVIFLAEELNAYINGLAAITAVGDQIESQISARDGVAASLYYLELYLHVGRTSHPTEYAAMKADATWQKLVRYEWARGYFWDAQAKPFPKLDMASSKIWAHVGEAANLDEIRQFTGDDPANVACHP